MGSLLRTDTPTIRQSVGGCRSRVLEQHSFLTKRLIERSCRHLMSAIYPPAGRLVGWLLSPFEGRTLVPVLSCSVLISYRIPLLSRATHEHERAVFVACEHVFIRKSHAMHESQSRNFSPSYVQSSSVRDKMLPPREPFIACIVGRRIGSRAAKPPPIRSLTVRQLGEASYQLLPWKTSRH